MTLKYHHLFRAIILILIFFTSSCDKDPIQYGIISFQKNYYNSHEPDPWCNSEAIITNTSTNKIITFVIEIKTKNRDRKISTEITLLPGSTEEISPACDLIFELKAAFIDKEKNKRIENNY
jgi:hypothetical protein